MELEIFDQTEQTVPSEQLDLVQNILQYAAQVLDLKGDTEMSVTFMNNAAIQVLNRDYRGVDRATDVMSFPMDEEDDGEMPILMDEELADALPVNLGDIFVSIDKVGEQADYLGHSYDRELGFLVVHGFLHLNGYDHIQPEDEQEMFKLQKDILDNYGLKREENPNN
ncbi:rRNA maturation RNase YbeY [Levilactobacillus bambusae]|uniref:Endoribonuclease YbeY n=1 Tax=Levilactobacillus bambusae TaxID=2024736 RepID=A0A2V1N4S7_9LACO|nr:rRNA maturation RNase YbeY [Levilactobacillus bambusae]PWG00770.1 rRNA maturation RNase YbeY [Levilactobacillus bambusae]